MVGAQATKDNNPLSIPVNDDDFDIDNDLNKEDEELSAYLRGKKTPGLRLSSCNQGEEEVQICDVEDFSELEQN